MKKNKSLQLQRETLRDLSTHNLAQNDLAQVQGGLLPVAVVVVSATTIGYVTSKDP